MRRIYLTPFVVTTVCGIHQQLQAGQETMQPLHVSNSFHFEIRAPLVRVAPLFGPQGERLWAGKHWNPEFIYPTPAADRQGAVFSVQHGPHKSTWVNTVFDLSAGRMQYVYFIPDQLVTVVTVALKQIDQSRTDVSVRYDRTALRPAANPDVQGMGERDRESGAEWRESIEAYFASQDK